MANGPIGITFAPTAEASANGPQQAGIDGQGGSDLAAAFKILSLHLPRVLGAASIAPKRLLNSQGAAAVSGGGFNPYSAVFQALLQSMTGGMNPGGGDVSSLSSLFGGGQTGLSPDLAGSSLPPMGGGNTPSGAPPPAIIPGSGLPRDPEPPAPPPMPSAPAAPWEDRSDTYSNRYI